MDRTPTRRDAWSRYWRTGALHSLAGTLPDDLRGTVGDFWEQVFTPLTQRDRVLDIGTGNGVLPALVCRTHPDAPPTIHAIDLADIAPGWIAQAPGPCRSAITFHAGVAAETLPFPDRTFDLIVSQYGIEYAGRDAAMAEVTRVLKPGGRLAVLMHHARSRLADVARDEEALSRWLCEPDGLLDRARAILVYLALGASAEGRARLSRDPRANAARAACNQALRDLSARAARSDVPDLLQEAQGFVVGQFEAAARSGDAGAAQQRIDAWRNSLQDAALRYRELCAAALDDAAMEALAVLLGQLGFDVDHAPLHHENGHLVAWALQATKR